LIYDNFSFSSITNSTFTNIISLHDSVIGGVMYIYARNDCSSFTINYCIFTQCNARGGALFLASDTPYIYIKLTHFKNKNTNYKNNIFVAFSPCFNLAENGSLDLFV
jgi:hypothetical protein